MLDFLCERGKSQFSPYILAWNVGIYVIINFIDPIKLSTINWIEKNMVLLLAV